MLDLLKLRLRHGRQAIPDIRKAEILPTHRGFPVIDENRVEGNTGIADLCPTGAITNHPLAVDLGKCIFCGACERASNGAIRFSSGCNLGTTNRERLVVSNGTSYEQYEESATGVRTEIRRLFGRSLKLRQVSAGGCNGCEMELGACGNVNFDMGRFGIDFVASPRHADGIVITGPIPKNMAPALLDTYNAVPDPKIVIAVGACAISGGIFADSPELNREFLNRVRVDLYIPGCPPHPLTIIRALLDFLGRK